MRSSMLRINCPNCAKARSLRRAFVIALAALLLCWPAPFGAQAAAGDLDPTFGSGGKVTTELGGAAGSLAHAVAIQNDGKIVAAGGASNLNTGFLDFGLARYNSNGDLDTGFGSGGKVLTNLFNNSSQASAVAIQSDGKIVAAGNVFGNGFLDMALVRYNANGSLDTNFGSGGKVRTDFFGLSEEAREVIVQGDGKIVLVGSTFTTAQHTEFALVRYNTDGTLDTSFGSSGKVTTDFFGLGAQALGATIQSDGKIIAVGGDFEGFALARYNSNGSLDTSFGSSGRVSTGFGGSFAQAAAIQNDGKIVVAGITVFFEFATLRYNSDGSVDTGFGNGGAVSESFFGGVNIASTVAIQNGDKIVVGGFATTNTAGRDFALVRYNLDGSPDTSFGSGGKLTTDFSGAEDSASKIAIQSDGKIVAAGFATIDPGGHFFALARYDNDFDLCLQDDGNDSLLQINSITGDYQFRRCSSGISLSGRGSLTRRGSVITLQHFGTDRRVMAKIDSSANKGTASIQNLSLGSGFTITDRNITNNTCACP